jgi:hypothetical protein
VSLFPVDGREGFASGLARPCQGREGLRYLVEDISCLNDGDYLFQSSGGLEIKREPSSRLNIIGAKAAKYGLAPIHIHSHPEGVSGFSFVDDRAKNELHDWLRQNGQPVFKMVSQSY